MNRPPHCSKHKSEYVRLVCQRSRKMAADVLRRLHKWEREEAWASPETPDTPFFTGSLPADDFVKDGGQ